MAAEITPLEIARFMGHAKVTTTLTVCTHLFGDDTRRRRTVGEAIRWTRA